MRQCMAGILGRKLGSTQIFDPESGACSHVTVIKAGPSKHCPAVSDSRWYRGTGAVDPLTAQWPNGLAGSPAVGLGR